MEEIELTSEEESVYKGLTARGKVGTSKRVEFLAEIQKGEELLKSLEPGHAFSKYLERARRILKMAEEESK